MKKLIGLMAIVITANFSMVGYQSYSHRDERAVLESMQDRLEAAETTLGERDAAVKKLHIAVTFANEKRFLVDDLLTGRIAKDHPLKGYLLDNGATEDDLAWFQGRRSPIDVRGLDYYRQSEWEVIGAEDKRWAENRAGFASVARDYIERYRLPVMLSETNYFGSPEERTVWLRHMLDEYRTLSDEGHDVRGFCWFPFISSTDFQHMLLQNRNDVDPVGLYDLDADRWERIPTTLIDVVRQELEK